MTWPLPDDRPRLPPRPIDDRDRATRRADRKAERARRAGITEHGWRMPWWHRDDLWMIGGAIFSIVLLIAFAAYWSTGGSSTSSGGVDGPPVGGGGGGPLAGPAGDATHLTPFWFVVGVLIVVFVLVMMGVVVWSIVTLVRDKGVRFEDVSAEEQARRRDVARLLKEVEPEVSQAEAWRIAGRPEIARLHEDLDPTRLPDPPG